MTWYEKKRWQRPMTFYETFEEHGCKDCYATYYAQQYGPDVASVRIVSHCEYPNLDLSGILFDMDYFFRLAKEPLVRSPPEELFVLNFCDDTLDECKEYTNRGRCTSRNDKKLLEMVLHCRLSCQMCDNDADTIEVGARIAAFSAEHRRYIDGTVLQVKDVHHIRQYLIKYDRFFDTPKWITAMSLRNQGVLILTAEDDIDDDDEEEEEEEESEEESNDEPEHGTAQSGTSASSDDAADEDELDSNQQYISNAHEEL
jgi:hypothetical protein